MSQTLLRLGLWIIVLVLALYVVRETFADSSSIEFMNDDILQKAGTLGVLLLVASGVAMILEKVFSKASTRLRHCSMCRQPVTRGEIYCRVHLRQILEREQELSRRSRIR